MGTTDKPSDAREALSPALQSRDILAGLGAAPRHLLATCLALFEDSTLQQRLGERVEGLKRKLTGSRSDKPDASATVTSLQRRVMAWMQSSSSDQELRLILWMRLREGLGLRPVTFGALRSTRTAADDLVAATLAFIQPSALEKAKDWVGWGKQQDTPSTLDALARQTMQELVDSALSVDGDGNPQAREALLRGAKEQIERLDPAARDRLLRAINARELNDDAIRTLMLTGGGLTAFGGAVSLAGFSAYILAAQASAFIPLLSGPALVSLVAVLSNPVTIVLATVGTGIWATRSANQKIQAAIAMRVIALLALSGIAAGEGGLRALVRVFPLLPDVRKAGELPVKVLQAYQADWKQIAPAHRGAGGLDPELAKAVDQPPPGTSLPDRWQRLLGSEAVQDMGVMSLLTVGELLYLVQALEPDVLAAADFSRIEDLGDPIAFAAFAHRIDGMDAGSELGALSNLKGYVAEQVVAARLADQGHVVDFPETSNQAGWDLSVDGIKFQVKNAADLDLLDRHFEKGYDYPVLANAEVADLLERARASGDLPEWADQVHFVEGYSSEAVQHATAETLAAGDSMLHPHVPVFAVLLTAARNLDRYAKGEMTGTQAVQDAVINGTIRAGLAVAGNYAGVGIGLLVFGPAGALVLGSALPILSRTQSNRLKKGLDQVTQGERYQAWEKQARATLDALFAVLSRGLERKADLIKSQRTAGAGKPAEYLDWRRNDDLRYLREAYLRLKTISEGGTTSVEEAGERMVVWLSTSTLHPAVYQKELSAWSEIVGARPDLAQNVSDGLRPAVNVVKGAVGGLLDGIGAAFGGGSKSPSDRRGKQ